MKICALCGDLIHKPDETVEHVPPKLFYPKSLRPAIREPFWTVPSHRTCNEMYRMDEEYFYYFLMPLVINENSEMGTVLLNDLQERGKNPQTVSMIRFLSSEMKAESPNGITLPPGIRRLSVNQVRIQNVALKIAQCIYFKEHNKILPKSFCKHCEVVERIEDLQPLFRVILDYTKPVSIAPDVFNYRYICVDGVHHFGFMFWAGYMFCLAFDDPEGRKNMTWIGSQ